MKVELPLSEADLFTLLMNLGYRNESSTMVPDFRRYYLKVETFLVYYLVKLLLKISTLKGEEFTKKLLQDVSVSLITSFMNGDQYFVNDLLANIIFKKLTHTDPISVESYDMLQTFYIRYMAEDKQHGTSGGILISLRVALVLGGFNAQETHSLLLHSKSVLPFNLEWIFLPIAMLHKAQLDPNAEVPPEQFATQMVRSVLLVILTMEFSNSKCKYNRKS